MQMPLRMTHSYDTWDMHTTCWSFLGIFQHTLQARISLFVSSVSWQESTKEIQVRVAALHS